MKVKGEQIVNASWSIANLLTEKREWLWECGDNIPEMRRRALSLLEDPRLTDKESVAKAKRIFSTAKDSLFMSTLITYMTGMKA